MPHKKDPDKDGGGTPDFDDLGDEPVADVEKDHEDDEEMLK